MLGCLFISNWVLSAEMSVCARFLLGNSAQAIKSSLLVDSTLRFFSALTGILLSAPFTSYLLVYFLPARASTEVCQACR